MNYKTSGVVLVGSVMSLFAIVGPLQGQALGNPGLAPKAGTPSLFGAEPLPLFSRHSKPATSSEIPEPPAARPDVISFPVIPDLTVPHPDAVSFPIIPDVTAECGRGEFASMLEKSETRSGFDDPSAAGSWRWGGVGVGESIFGSPATDATEKDHTVAGKDLKTSASARSPRCVRLP